MQTLIEDWGSGLTADQVWAVLQGDSAIAFLDSRPGYGQLGRYSIFGLNPWQRLRVTPEGCWLDGHLVDEEPFALLERLLTEHRTTPIPGLPIHGGCIGTIAYDTGFVLNELPLPFRAAASGLPLMSFDFYDNFLVFDHDKDHVIAVACGQLAPAADSLRQLRDRLAEGAPKPMPRGFPVVTLPLPPEADYCAKVEAVREHIRRGDVYITNLTHTFTVQSEEPAHLLYSRLRRVNPAPFAAFVRQDQLEIVSASPERLLRVDADGRVVTRPIKGTRPRGRDAAEDLRNATELLDSGKDRSELLMITDLERNDLSKVCLPDSVRVDELFTLETYPTVLHLTAQVSGRLRPDISAVAALKACSPGGSITGAPKVAAMQIIDGLEDQARGLYTGCMGYFSCDGQADFSILIRTAVKQGSTITYGAGGGITWESDAAAEYREMLIKAESFRQIMEGEG